MNKQFFENIFPFSGNLAETDCDFFFGDNENVLQECKLYMKNKQRAMPSQKTQTTTIVNSKPKQQHHYYFLVIVIFILILFFLSKSF